MPEKIIGTLTSRILKSVHTLIYPIISCKLCSGAISEHPEPFSLRYYVRIVALMPDLQRVSLPIITNPLYYSSTTKRILSIRVVKESYLSSKASPLYGKSTTALWRLWHADLYKIATRDSTSDSSECRFWLVRNNPARPTMFTMKSYLCNVHPCVAENPACRNDFMVRGSQISTT